MGFLYFITLKNMINKETRNSFISRGILRTPLLSFNKVNDINSISLKQFALTPIVQEALLLASSSFYEEVTKWLNGEITEEEKVFNIEKTLYKYITRASTRSTPFGLFGTTSFIEVNTEPGEKFSLNTEITKYSRLDTCSLQLIINYLIGKNELKKHLKYTSNNSIYDFGDHLRYFETINVNNTISFELSRVSQNHYLNKILSFCNEPRKLDQIKAVCFEKDNPFTADEITSFLFDLIDSKLLISELEILLTETDPLQRLLHLLQELSKETKEGKEDFIDLKCLDSILNILKGNGSVIPKYYETISKFEEMDIKPKAEDILHVDSSRYNEKEIHIEEQLLKELIEAKNLLLKLTPKQIDQFEQFKKNYNRRYGERSMPLLHIMDPEAGIGYTHKGEKTDGIPLLNNINFRGENYNTGRTPSLSVSEAFLLSKLLESYNSKSKEINLEYEEVKTFSSAIKEPHTMGAFFSLLEGGKKIYLELFSGSSAINFFNRFSYLDERIVNLCEDIAEFEQKSNPNHVLAEIIHLPELKSGNLLLHKKLREYEIPCVTKSQNPQEKTILLSDIQVRVTDNSQIELYSTKLKKPIIPKLSNTLNYSRNSMDIFRFLSDFQFQNECPVIQFDWYSIRDLFDYYPRVNYKNIILSPAFWAIPKKELLGGSYAESFENRLATLRTKRGIPDKVNLSIDIKDDNKLFIDFTNKLGVEVFRKELAKSNKVILSEVLTLSGTPIADNSGDFYHNEIILPIINNNPVNHNEKSSSLVRKSSLVEDIFFPGSQWAYFKIYTGHKMVDELLSNSIRDLAVSFHEEAIILKWFFVRYSDDDFHVRVRFLLTSSDNLLEVTKRINNILQPYKTNRIIHNIIIDTYKREIERYGSEYIESCEEIFSSDSFAVCNYLGKYKNNDDLRWVFSAIGVNGYLNDFKFNIEEKIKILSIVSDQFFKEFGGSKRLKIQLDHKYRQAREILSIYLSGNDISNEAKDFLEIIQARSDSNRNAVLKLTEDIKKNNGKDELIDIVQSIVHLFLNRLFSSNHRKQEMVLYYIMWKHYKSEKAKMVKKSPIYA